MVTAKPRSLREIRTAVEAPGAAITPEELARLNDAGHTEAHFQREVEKACARVGALYYHTHDSRRSPSGYPDLVIITIDDRILYRELKTESGRVTPQQKVWISRLERAGQDVAVWRPSDWPEIRTTLGAPEW